MRVEGARDAALGELEAAGRELAELRAALEDARDQVARVEEARDAVAAELAGAEGELLELKGGLGEENAALSSTVGGLVSVRCLQSGVFVLLQIIFSGT